MPTKFDDYVREVEEKARADGPEAVAQWDAFNAYFAVARKELAAPRSVPAAFGADRR